MSAFRTLDDLDVGGRRVLVRVDFNVPIHDGEIVDDRRIRAALPTITALRERGARVVVVTHLGRPKGQPNPKYSVTPLAARLGSLLGCAVFVAADVAGDSARALVAGMQDGEVVMVENVRFEPGEEANDAAFAQQLASLADAYVNDAFGAAHRAHASTEGVAHLLPSAAGLLMERELTVLGSVFADARRPLVSILGGAKISTKLGVMTNLMSRVDTLFVGGAMACTFYLAREAQTGTSLVEPDQVDVARGILEGGSGGSTLVLPVDVVVAKAIDDASETAVVAWDAIPADRTVVDIGPRSVEAIAAAVHDAGTVVWNGPLGVYEVEEFAQGTRAVARALGASDDATSIVGGGDLGAAIDDAGVANSIDFISTGGGATLEFLEGRTLPGVAALQRS